MDRERFIGLLNQILAAVTANDSFQGSLEYDLRPGEGGWIFNVNAAIRVGNSEGQGGMILVQEWQSDEFCDHPCDEFLQASSYGEQALCKCAR